MDYKTLILDHTIFEAFQNGDENAFSKVYDAFKRVIYITTVKIVGSPEDAEDVTTQAFMRVWERRRSIESMGHLKNLLFIIARNISINVLRDKKYNSYQLTDEVLEQVDDSNKEKYNTDQLFADLVEDIHAAMKQMPKVRQKVFRMLYMEDKSADEIATQLNVTIQTVYWHTKQATAQLREILLKGNVNSSKILAIILLLIFSKFH